MPRSGKTGVIELPRYVHRVIKKTAAYTFYTRHRNTPRAWPSIMLPAPLEPEFAPRLAICEKLERANDAFQLHGVDLPDHHDRNFWRRAGEIERAKERRDHQDAKDFTALVETFKEHEAYTSLAASTRRGYDRSADMVLSAWAYDLPTELTTVDAQASIDALGDTPATANQFRAFGSRLMSWGIPRGFCTSNAFEHTEKIPGGEPWKSWPEWAIEVLLQHAPFNVLMPAISAFFTGQRQGDVLRMPRPGAADAEIEVTAQKTGKTVWVPIHGTYRGWVGKALENAIAAAEARRREGVAPLVSSMLHLGVRGLPYQTTDGYRAEWQRMMNTEPFQRHRAERLVFHGLRKNAVINLLEVGCTETMVGSIVNMSEQMVRHYGQEVHRRRLARDGVKLLEAQWNTVTGSFAIEQEQNTNWKPARRIGNRWERGHREE